MLTPTPSVSVPLMIDDEPFAGETLDEAAVARQHAAVVDGETARQERAELLAERRVEPLVGDALLDELARAPGRPP